MLKAGIIGLGHGSRVLIEAFRINKIEVYGVASKNFLKASKVGKANKIKIVFKSWKELVNTEEIDIVAIAVPPNLQISILKECLKKKKILLCEKPILTDYIKNKNIFNRLANYNKLFLVDYIFPEHKAFKVFKTLVSRKKINSNSLIRVKFETRSYININNINNWKLNPKKGGGLINLYLTHIIDYLIIFFGKIKNIETSINRNKFNEISMKCRFEFNSGPIAEIYIDSNSPNKIHSIEFINDKNGLLLENKSKDYCKGFKLHSIKFDLNGRKSLKKISINDKIKNFKGDSRILLTSRIIKKIKAKNKISNLDLKENIKKYKYNELILNKIRNSNNYKKL